MSEAHSFYLQKCSNVEIYQRTSKHALNPKVGENYQELLEDTEKERGS
jgi:hypothetical protein